MKKKSRGRCGWTQKPDEQLSGTSPFVRQVVLSPSASKHAQRSDGNRSISAKKAKTYDGLLDRSMNHIRYSYSYMMIAQNSLPRHAPKRQFSQSYAA